jgi:formamidopyrimidine-DNA glycosylase
MRRVLVGKKIVDAEILRDDIILSKVPPEAIRDAVIGRKVTGIGRKGKYWWIEFADAPWLFGHLGMAGWIREVPRPGQDVKETRIREHGDAPLYDAEGKPRFMKMMLTTEDGGRIAFTDGRRLGRMWLSESAAKDKKLKQIGPDVLEHPYSVPELKKILNARSAPIKALLLDQTLFAGVGNWIADEALYQARISPKREAKTLTDKEIKKLIDALKEIVEVAVEVEADKEKLPVTWMFHHRWGGDKGVETIEGKEIVREQVGGRTTAWVPAVQK